MMDISRLFVGRKTYSTNGLVIYSKRTIVGGWNEVDSKERTVGMPE